GESWSSVRGGDERHGITRVFVEGGSGWVGSGYLESAWHSHPGKAKKPPRNAFLRPRPQTLQYRPNALPAALAPARHHRLSSHGRAVVRGAGEVDQRPGRGDGGRQGA